MSLDALFARFDAAVAGAHPQASEILLPGASDEDIDGLKAAVAPLALPDEVESLLRWHNGTTKTAFGHWRMLDCASIIESRTHLEEYIHAPAWLTVFDWFGVGVAMLDVPGAETLTGIWAFHPDSTEIVRYFDSMTNMLEICALVIETGVLVWHQRPGFIPADPDEPTFDAARRAGTVQSVVYPRHIPEGASISRFAEPDWPRSWLLSQGLAEDVAVLRGATHTIAELIAQSAASTAKGTVVGRITALMASTEWSYFTLTDGSAAIEVSERGSAFMPVIRSEFEVDVSIEKGAAVATTSALRPIPPLD